MTVKDIYSYLDFLYPFDKAADFDNVGLLIGDMNQTITKVIVALDCTKSVLSKAKEIGAELIITHHPVIFEPLKTLCKCSLPYELVNSSISVISAHTNLDIANGGVNKTLCNVLGLQNVSTLQTDDFEIKVGCLNKKMSPDDFAKKVSNSLGCTVKYVPGNRDVLMIGVCAGSGADFMDAAVNNGADAFVTGDVKHHYFADAESGDITLIDAGHFDTENIIVDELVSKLSERFGDIFIAYTDKYIKSITGNTI